jgi:hypothetical protein
MERSMAQHELQEEEERPMQAVLERDERPNTRPRPALLYGVAAIAEHIGVAEEATRHLIRKGVLPAFKIGRTVAARPEKIDAALDELERQQAETADA